MKRLLYLALADTGNYAQSWDGAAALFKGAITKANWEQALKSARGPARGRSRLVYLVDTGSQHVQAVVTGGSSQAFVVAEEEVGRWREVERRREMQRVKRPQRCRAENLRSVEHRLVGSAQVDLSEVTSRLGNRPVARVGAAKRTLYLDARERRRNDIRDAVKEPA